MVKNMNKLTLIEANNYANPFVNYDRRASKKPSHCCAKRSPWRGAFSEIVMTDAQDAVEVTRRMLYNHRRRHARRSPRGRDDARGHRTDRAARARRRASVHCGLNTTSLQNARRRSRPRNAAALVYRVMGDGTRR